MLQAELSSCSCADAGRSLNTIQKWRPAGGARDIQGGLSQKVRLIKSREVTREPELPHTPYSNALTHAGVDKKERVELPLSSAWKDNSQPNITF